ncbi:MAG: hypothetical protein JWP61_668, partial [Friedmanniella sp.]|nr:hypothetical protein [Friedmanniella sp.]
LDQLAVDVAEGRLDAYAAAARLLERRPPDHRPAPLA